MAVIGTPVSSDDISVFTTKTSARTFGGPFNADTYFDKENDADAGKIAAAWLLAGQRTDADIRNAWRARLGNVRITHAELATIVANYADEAAWLAETADWGIIVRGYEGRGVQDSNDQQAVTDRGLDGRMAGLRKQYRERLAMIASGSSPLIQSEAAAGYTRGTNAPVLPRAERFGRPSCVRTPYGWGWC